MRILPAHRLSQQVLCYTLYLSCTLFLWGCVSTSSQPFVLLSSGDLTYPEDAKQAQITGTVTIKYDIQADGTVANVSVVNADPPGVFDTEAVRFVHTWVFLPARRDKIPQVTENVESEIRFELSELMDDPPDY